MPLLTTAIVVAGVAVVVAGLLDAFLTILHPDRDGPLSRRLNHAIWRGTVALARATPRAGREILALAGPVMVLLDILLWMAVPILGYALVVWPFLGTAFDTPGPHREGFIDALYFSGVTFTTLGFGDITPTARLFEALAVAQAISGFAVMSIAIAYVVGVFEGVDQRDSLALRVYSETGGTWHGQVLIVRAFTEEGVEVLRERLETWAAILRDLHGRLYRFHGLAFYLRTRGLRHGPERLLYALAEVALAASIVARAPGLRPLRPAAEHFTFAFDHFADAVVRRHGTREARAAMESPTPIPEDAQHIEEVWGELADALRLHDPDLDCSQEAAIVRIAARKRVFLEQVDEFTCWRSLREDPGPKP